MKQHFSPARPAIAAIAAVIAIPSTAALAQTVDAAPPVIIAPTAEPATPAPAQTAPAPAATPQVIFQPSAPVVQPTPAPSAPPVTAAEEAPAARPATRSVREAAPTRTPSAERQAPVAEARPVPTSVSSVNPNPVERSVAAPTPEVAPVTAAPQTLPEEGGSDTMLWLLGLGALGLLAGGAYAAAKRNRREEGEIAYATPIAASKEPFVAVDPTERLLTPEERIIEERHAAAPYVEPRITAPAAAPIPAASELTDRQRDDYADTSLSERREALVAQAPSAENPFRTRKNRLRRANFLLSREGVSESSSPVRAEERAEAPSAPSAPIERPQVSYSFGSSGALKPPVLKPRYN